MTIRRLSLLFRIALLHPVTTHFTIALFSVSLLLDLIGLRTGKSKFHEAAWFNLVFAGIAAVCSVATGLLARSNTPIPASAQGTLETHQTIAFLMAGAIVVLLFWRIAQKGHMPEKYKTFYIIASILTLLILFTGNYYGGELVYRHGVAVEKYQPKSTNGSQHRRELLNPDTVTSIPQEEDKYNSSK